MIAPAFAPAIDDVKLKAFLAVAAVVGAGAAAAAAAHPPTVRWWYYTIVFDWCKAIESTTKRVVIVANT